MSELDKKLQKSPTDLVQSVLEAMEKRNIERVDLLISGAFRQLKTTRFKPDQTICISLTYLARICPKAFSQSANTKELLKSYVRRDSGPANIKGTKNDFIVPVLAANILLSCCDSADVRAIILARIEQWIGSNQKLNELVQHLLAILCTRCHDDSQTIKTLIEIRNHWYQYLDSNHSIYGPISGDLSKSIRDLLLVATSCESLTENLYFLQKHDSDVTGLASSISKLITRRPITFASLLDHPDLGDQLAQMLISVYDKLFADLDPTIKKEELDSHVFIQVPQKDGNWVVMEQSIIEALLILISTSQMHRHIKDYQGPLMQWFREQQQSPHKLAYKDSNLTQPMEVPTRLLQRLIRSQDMQVDLALKIASPSQLIDLVQTFGIGPNKLKKVLAMIDDSCADDVIKSGIKQLPYFNEMIELYEEMGLGEARKLVDLDSSYQDIKKVEQKPEILVKVKTEVI